MFFKAFLFRNPHVTFHLNNCTVLILSLPFYFDHLIYLKTLSFYVEKPAFLRFGSWYKLSKLFTAPTNLCFE